MEVELRYAGRFFEVDGRGSRCQRSQFARAQNTEQPAANSQASKTSRFPPNSTIILVLSLGRLFVLEERHSASRTARSLRSRAGRSR